MEWDIPLRLEHVLGDTYCIVTGYVRIPLYRLDKNRVVLMDSGLALPDRKKLLALLEREGMRVAAVLTTHAHIDHIGNHSVLKELHGASLYMTPYAAAQISGPLNMGGYIYNVSYRGIRKTFATMFCQADHVIQNTDTTVTVEGAVFDILRLNGHAPEHIGFVTPDGAAYPGDTLLTPEVQKSLHVPFCMCPELDMEAKERLAQTDYPVYILAHNGLCDNPRETAKVNIALMQEKMESILRLAREPVSQETLLAGASAAMGVQWTAYISSVWRNRACGH